VNVTTHVYWNLTGNLFQKISDHLLWVPYGLRYVVNDEDDGLPTGTLRRIKESKRLDFWSAARWLGDTGGLDHCFVHEPRDGVPMKALKATLECQSHRLRMQLDSDHPALQVYTANALPDEYAARPHDRHRAVCLEPQHCPDSPNHPDDFPPGFVLRPGHAYHHRATFSFTVQRFGEKTCPSCGHTRNPSTPRS